MRPATTVLVLVMATATPLLGQGHAVPKGLGLAVSGAFVTLSGERFETLGDAIGGSAAFRYTTGDGLDVRIGGAYSAHPLEGLDISTTATTIFIETRWVATRPTVAPFVGIRAGLNRLRTSIDNVTGTAVGSQFGAVGGLVYQVSGRMGLETGLALTWGSYDGVRIDGTIVGGTAGNGSKLELFVGVALTFAPTPTGRE